MPKLFDTSKPGAVGEYLKETINSKARIDVVSSIFTMYAFEKIEQALKKTSQVRFLFNEPAFLDEKDIVGQKDVKEFMLSMGNREQSVSQFDLEITLKNNLDQDSVAARFADFIEKKVDVKSVVNRYLINQKFITVRQKADSYNIQGPNLDFSLEGLGFKNRIQFGSNVLMDDDDNIQHMTQMFEAIYESSKHAVDVKAALLKHLKQLYKDNSAELVYYLTLYNIFKEHLLAQDEVTQIKERTGIQNTKIWQALYNFQMDAVIGAIKKLELYNGCIIADSVGLGKTYEALAIIKYYELRNDRVLVLAPKKLRGNWTSFKYNVYTNPFIDDRFNYDVLNHTDLSREDGLSGEIELSQVNWGNYDLLVIDESHNFRNRPSRIEGKTRYERLMDDIIKSNVKTKVLMLSATPVNNRLADLKNQIMFITEDEDQAFKDNLGINSIGYTLTKAQARFNAWGELDDDARTTESLLGMLDYDFFKLLNALTIARSRKHIQKYYDTKDIGEFPERLKPKNIKSNIDDLGIFPPLKSINDDINKLQLSVYSPMLYVLPTRLKHYEDQYSQRVLDGKSVLTQSDRERSLIHLMRVNILKRLESSVHSFKLTLERLLNKVDEALEQLEKGSQFQYQDIDEFDDDFEEPEFGSKIKVKVKDLDVIRYKNDLLEDQALIQSLLNYAKQVSAQEDAKLAHLRNLIKKKMNHPINSNNQKILIFTTFADTAKYLYEHLSETSDLDGIHLGLVTGGDALKSTVPKMRPKFDEILAHFSPKSSKIRIKHAEIDILIATDCISEGQNLQDCDYLVNYDIHWNPVRIIQRFGRIDRIGSENSYVQLVNFWPNMELDEYINLEARVKNRMVMLDLSATGEDDVLTAESKDLEYRAEQMHKLQEAVLDIEDVSDNISITDLTLDDFILTLERYMKANLGVLEKYPTGVHAVTGIPEKLKNDAVPGVIFTLKQIRYDSQEQAANSLYPYYLVYVKEDGTIHVSNGSPKTILDLYKGLCVDQSALDETRIAQFEVETQKGQKMQKYTTLLEKAIFDIKGFIEEKGVKSLFKAGKSSLINQQIQGLNDFELISFLVVKL